MEREYIMIKMESYMKEILKMVDLMEKEYIIIKVEIYIKEILKME